MTHTHPYLKVFTEIPICKEEILCEHSWRNYHTSLDSIPSPPWAKGTARENFHGRATISVKNNLIYDLKNESADPRLDNHL